jgi:hypothetical protein
MPKIIDSTFFMKKREKKERKLNLCFSQAMELIIFGYYFNLFVQQFPLFWSKNGTNHYFDKTYIVFFGPFLFLLFFFFFFFFEFSVPSNHLMAKSNGHVIFSNRVCFFLFSDPKLYHVALVF